MAPLSKARVTKLVETDAKGDQVYEVDIDPEWIYISVPYGGWLFAILMNSAIQSQKGTPTPDPLSINIFFLRPMTRKAKISIHVRTIRRGRAQANLQVDLYQEGKHKATSHLIFTSFSASSTNSGPTLPAKHASVCPLQLYPANFTKEQYAPKHPWMRFRNHFDGVVDLSIGSRNAKSAGQAGRRGPDWGAWIIFHEDKKAETTGADMLGLAVDMTFPVLITLTGEYVQPLDFWNATLSISLEFKTKFPLDTDGGKFSPHTIGVFATERHLMNGRHSDVVELWTAPSASVKDTKDGKWREEMRCVAVGSITGIATPVETNHRYAESKGKL